jgi:hypothetical protein
MQGDNTTLPSCGLRLSSMGKSKGYVFGRTGSGTYVSTDLPEAVVGAARRAQPHEVAAHARGADIGASLRRISSVESTASTSWATRLGLTVTKRTAIGI